MKKNETDRFEGIAPAPIQNDNFFLFEQSPNLINKRAISEPARRLNDYDFNLLKEDAYKDISDDVFKLEYKIYRTVDEINTLKQQMQSALDIGDYNLVNDLTYRKKVLEEDYEALIAIYNDKSISAKISDKILGIFGKKTKEELTNFQKKIPLLSETIIATMPKQLASIFELKKSLNKLENLNKSVDELISMNIPYGENYNKYEQLSKYIIKANSIQAEISRNFKGK